MGPWNIPDQQDAPARHRVRLDGDGKIPDLNTHPRSLSNPTLPMRFTNKSKPSIIVEVVSIDAKLRVGETKWDAVVYRRVDDGQIHVRPKPEFFEKFVPIDRK
jgi:hypothetical protein